MALLGLLALAEPCTRAECGGCDESIVSARLSRRLTDAEAEVLRDFDTELRLEGAASKVDVSLFAPLCGDGQRVPASLEAVLILLIHCISSQVVAAVFASLRLASKNFVSSSGALHLDSCLYRCAVLALAASTHT